MQKVVMQTYQLSRARTRQGLDRMGITALFFFSPIISLVVALNNFKVSWSKNLVWAFVVFFGFTFVVSNQMDSTRYSDSLVRMAKLPIGNLANFLSLIYEKETGYVDVLQPLLTFIVSRFTDNSRVLFAVFGFVFGFFYSRNLWFLFSFVEGKLKREAIPFLLLAALVIAIWQINGFRFWTAAHVFVFGIFTLLTKGKIKGLVLCSTSLLIHFSFILPVLLTFIYLLAGNRLVIFMILYFASFFITQVRPEALKSYSGKIPEVFQERTEAYTSEKYIKERGKLNQQANWYVEGRVIAIHYSINLLLAVLFFRYKTKISSNKIAAGMLCFGLLLATVTNLLSQVPSMLRFQMVSDIILFSFFFLFVQQEKRNVFPQWVYIPFLLSAILYLVVEIRIGFETASLLTVLGNPLIAPFLSNDYPLIDFFK
jgi:hypothetical protein